MLKVWTFYAIIVVSNAFLNYPGTLDRYYRLLQRNHDRNRFSIPLETYSTDTSSILSTDIDAVLSSHYDEIVRLRGTPELVDKLENLVSKHPGIELNIDTYRSIYPFPLDQFQVDGLMSLMKGHSALISTPTGSGKTVVGELAIYFALMMGLRVVYTTPLKALSNQKYQDFKARYGADRVGLMTGDIAINRGAPITIMTTEVFRNIIYDADASHLVNLFMVCFDEFHYMNDADRGTVWEESVISCPPSVRILALSATMGNVEEIRGWISSIHGPTDLILSTHRPVPLRYIYATKQCLMPLFRDPNAGPGSLNGITRIQGKLHEGSVLNPSITKLEDQYIHRAQQQYGRNGRPLKQLKSNLHAMIPKYSDVAIKLHKLNLVPAIIFIFSRIGCEDAAKELQLSSTSLLNDHEIKYVNQAISAFMKVNPDIPVSRAKIQMLKSGVGVHHAGLIPVWKAFIEDLFNANKIKVLFATETLAAGVNMPARATVISTVTKRVNTEIMKLKTSQLLQMAGRAGRRGKDEEGTVVIVKNRFEDSRIAHKILTSPVDDIKSHFKTSYGLTIKLLQTRDMAACKSLIEKGFGAYLLSRRLKKRETGAKEEVDEYRLILQKYTLKGAREYYKWLRRYEKESRNEAFLIDKLMSAESDLIQAITDSMPLGAGLLLRNDESGYFLGDVKWGDLNEKKGFGVLTKAGSLLIVQKDHIRCIAENVMSLSIADAQALTELFSIATDWKEIMMPSSSSLSLSSIISSSSTSYMLQGSYAIHEISPSSKIHDALSLVMSSPSIPIPAMPGAVIRQQQITAEVLVELQRSSIYVDDAGDDVIQALQHVAALRDPVSFVNQNMTSSLPSSSSSSDVYAWIMFMNVYHVLQQYHALNGTNATELGYMIGSLSGDNELWLALVLQSPLLHHLQEAELGAVMSAIVVDGHKASNAYFDHVPSEKVQAVYDELEKLAGDLRVIQADASLDFPINLCQEIGGMTEAWIHGISWRELCHATSLDQGDICRILRRTVEILRQIPQAIGVSMELASVASRAADRMDRFPVAELDTQTGELKDTSGVGFGLNSVVLRSNTVDIDANVNIDGAEMDDALLLDDDNDDNIDLDKILGIDNDDDDDDDMISQSSIEEEVSDKESIENLTKLTQAKLRSTSTNNNNNINISKSSSPLSRRTGSREYDLVTMKQATNKDVKVSQNDGIDLDELLGIPDI